MGKLKDRLLPNYTFGEELFNMISHIAGAFLGMVVLTMCVARCAVRANAFGMVGSAIYGGTMIVLYIMSSVYHGLPRNNVKKVFRVLDHCTIYFLIAGTYTAIALSAIREVDPAAGWIIFGIQWGLTALAVTLTAIDLKKFEIFSMCCYAIMGWCIIVVPGLAIKALTVPGFVLILIGGVIYTLGAVLYAVGKKIKYIHSVFHLFVFAGSLVQFLGVFMYAL
jgi:hemolysin III